MNAVGDSRGRRRSPSRDGRGDGRGGGAEETIACSRANMQLLFCDIKDLVKLVEVERLYNRRQRHDGAEAMLLVRNLLVRFNSNGRRLGQVVQYVVQDGVDRVLVQVGAARHSVSGWASGLVWHDQLLPATL